MNEHIDLAFLGAKVVASNNDVASLAVHCLSVAYNIGQMAWFRTMLYREQNNQLALKDRYALVSDTVAEQYRQEMIKHTVLAGIDILYLFFMGAANVKKGQRV